MFDDPIFNQYQTDLDSFDNSTDNFDTKLHNLPNIHIRNIQRNGRKTITIIEGLLSLDKNINLKKLLKTLKTNCHCNGSIDKNAKDIDGPIILLSGDHRKFINEFIIKELECDKDWITIHGY